MVLLDHSQARCNNKNSPLQQGKSLAVGIERRGSAGDICPLIKVFFPCSDKFCFGVFVLASPSPWHALPFPLWTSYSKYMCDFSRPPGLHGVSCFGLRCHPMNLHWHNSCDEIIVCINSKCLSSLLGWSLMRSGTISSFSTSEPRIRCDDNTVLVEGAC